MQQEPRNVTISFETFVKRSWPILVLGAVLICGAVGILLWYAVSGAARRAPAQESATSTPAVTTSTNSIETLAPRSLDGVLVAPEESRLQPFAVMIDNQFDARPQAGVTQANLVFELPVEGGITRLMAVFDATSSVPMIGPIRSARPYFVDLADGLNAVYGHVGGSQEALDLIKQKTGFRDLNEFANGDSYWRSDKRAAPHNTYTRTDLLKLAYDKKKWSEGHFHAWTFKDDAPLESTTSTTRGSEAGPSIYYGGSYTVQWSYDKTTNVYTRKQGGKLHKDQDNVTVTAKNVILIATDGEAVDDYGRLHVRTTGKGKATVYRDGKMMEGTWQRSPGEYLRFTGNDGADMVFNRGTTWLEYMIGAPPAGSSPTATTSTKQ